MKRKPDDTFYLIEYRRMNGLPYRNRRFSSVRYNTRKEAKAQEHWALWAPRIVKIQIFKHFSSSSEIVLTP